MEQGYTVKQTTNITGASPRQLQRWAESGLMVPSVANGLRGKRGGQSKRLYSFTDLIAIKTMVQLRDSMTPQKMHQVKERLLSYGRSFTDTRLLILGDDIYFPVGKDQLVALLDRPGQMVMYPLIININLETIETEVKAAISKAA
jgi:hypothetical protein